MPDGSDRPKLPRPPRERVADYDVGYGKTPIETRFKPGQSGNPCGRPKGAKTKKSIIPAKNEERLKQVVLEECYRTIDIRDGEKAVALPVIQTVVRSLALNAVRGNQRSQRILTDLLKWVEREQKTEWDEYLKTMIEYKVEWEQILAHREEQGITGSSPYPHPDDIKIDMATGDVKVLGPMTPDEEDFAEQWVLKNKIKALLKEAEAEAAREPNSQEKQGQVDLLRSALKKMTEGLKNHPGAGRFPV
jgi:hypothetical protein